MTDLLPLLFVVPISASILSLLLGLKWHKTGWYVAFFSNLVHSFIAILLAYRIFSFGSISYVAGGFTAPYGIELILDGISVSLVILISLIALGVLLYSRSAGPRSNQFYSSYLLLVAGLSGVSITGDLFNMYVFLEISGLAAYILVASGRDGKSALASLKYLIVGTIGASLFLLGVGFAYVATGTLNMGDLSSHLANFGYDTTLVRTAYVFIVIGLFVKIAVFPLHTWQPDAYSGAPDSVSGLISALVSTVAAYALIRIILNVFTVDFLNTNPIARDLLIYSAIISIISGSILAISQKEIKRMLAYSSVSQFGLIVGALSITNYTALIGGLVTLIGHAIMKGSLFLTAGLIGSKTGIRTVDKYKGLNEYMPGTTGIFGVLALSMVGVPPTIGFIGKWYIALGAIEANLWPLAIVILISTLLTLGYFLRIIERMYFHESSGQIFEDFSISGYQEEIRTSMNMYAPILVAALFSVFFGFIVIEYSNLLEPTIDNLLS